MTSRTAVRALLACWVLAVLLLLCCIYVLEQRVAHWERAYHDAQDELGVALSRCSAEGFIERLTKTAIDGATGLSGRRP